MMLMMVRENVFVIYIYVSVLYFILFCVFFFYNFASLLPFFFIRVNFFPSFRLIRVCSLLFSFYCVSVSIFLFGRLSVRTENKTTQLINVYFFIIFRNRCWRFFALFLTH